MQRRPRPTRRLLLLLVALPALALLTAQIVLAAPPDASFTISDSTAVRGQEITFEATATDPDPGDTISAYAWDFGDGITGDGPRVSHTYSALGPKTVTLTVTDSAGEQRVVTEEVIVENVPPTASFSVSNSTPTRGQLVGFDATATDPDGDIPLSYHWNFGDGTTANGQNVTHAYPANTSLGAKTVTLTVTDSAGAATVETRQVTVRNALPTASFTISDDTPVRGQSIAFDASAADPDGDIVSYEWNFGDGTTGSGKNVSHAYSGPLGLGTKTVTLTVTDSSDETTVVSDQVTVVNVPPNASFTVSSTTPVRGQLVGFNATATDPDGDTPLSYQWNFGDGTTGSGQNVTHAYPAGTSLGAKTVRLTVTDSANGTSVVTEQVTVRNAPPSASFTVSDPTPTRGQSISFNATATDFDGQIASYQWNFGDGTTGSGQTVAHTYSGPTGLGTKTVTLTVTDSAGDTTAVTDQVTIENVLPNATFSVSDGTPARGQPVNFTATATDPDGDTPLSYEWNFGDGTTATGPSPTHAYPANTTLGAKTVTLTVTDAANGTRVVNQQVTVQNALPTASFTVSDPTPARGQSVAFNATATDFEGPIASYQWSFGDGSTATGQNVSHTYPANTALGAKTATLTVTDAAGATTVATQQVTVQNALPNPVISVSDATPDIGQTVTFNGSASSDFEGPISDTNHDWDLDGDGSFESSGKTPSRSYSTPGPVTVRLQVMDSNGATEIATQVITVNGNVPPTAVPAISHEDEPGGTPGIDVGETVSFDGSPSTAGEPGDAITKYEWDLDGNGTFERTGRTHTRTYSTAGTVTVTLRVTDAGGATHSASQTITVITNNPPTARLSVSHVDQPEGTAGVDVGEAVNFNGSGSDAGGDPNDAIARYEWDLDGNPSTGLDGFELNTGRAATASRSYSTTGPVTVRLRVTDSKGAAHTASQAITVSNKPPEARFTISGAAVNAVANVGDTVNFDATSASPGESSDTIALYEWDLDGNGTFETQGQTASRSYTTPAPVDVKLRVTDRAGATHVASTPDLRINARPVARIGIVNARAETGQKPTVPLAGQAFQFTAGAVGATAGAPPAPGCPASAVTPASPASSDFEGPITAYHWDLDGNGQFNDGTGQTVSVSGYPADPSPRTVGLRVVDSDGASHSTTLTFRVNRPPAPDFVLEPLTPVINQQVTFSTTSGDPDDADTTLTHSWDLDGDGTFCETGEQGPSVRRAFTSAGAKKVRLRVTDTGGVTREVTRDVLIQNTIPNGSISFSPDAPLPGQAVTFVGSGSSPTNKPIKPLAWNFDFDAAGFDPASTQFPAHATGASVTWSFPTPGPRTVALKVSEEGGGFRIVTGTIVVNAPPSASFSVSDASPFTGVPVTISSTSQDPDGPLAGQQWDLDNDGQFDDASGPVAFASFATPGVRRVSLRVTDTRGATSTAVRDVTVRAVPPPPPPPPPQPPQLLQGVVVRIKGSVVGAYTKVKRLLVRAPEGANVLVRCRGKSCPKKAGRASRLSKGGQLRFKQLERRLRAGTRITVQVTQPGFVGRVTRFGMRKKAAPKRADLCLPPGAKRPAACPGW